MSQAPVVSVTMPVYNAQRYLREAIDSILTQTFTDFEFLIVDDGSTDDSTKILRRYAEDDARIKLIVRENRGLVNTLNEMVGMARGEFVARMDSDDVALPHRFECQFAFLRQHPEIGVLGSRVAWVDPEGNILREFCGETTHEEIDRAHLAFQGGTISHPAVMIRAEILRAVGGYRTEFTLAEDFDLWLRLAEVSRLANFPEVLLKYRLHPSSRGYSHEHRQTEFIKQAVLDACVRRGIPVPSLPVSLESPLKVEADHRMTWAWWALKGDNIVAARKNAIRSVWLRPLSKEGWRVLVCSLRGF